MSEKYRILITGSEGSLGQAIIGRLQNTSHEVYGVDNLSRYNERGPWAGTYKFLLADLTDPFAVEDMLLQAMPNIIIQGAATIYGVGGFHAYPATILSNDLGIQINLLNKIKELYIENYLKRFIYISSSMVYEGMNEGEFREDDELLLPKTDYGLSKVTGERIVKAFNKQYGLPYTIFRPFNIITPYEKVDDVMEQGTSHVFADFINNIVVKKLNPLPIIGDGSQVRCFTWIDDVASAIYDFGVMNSASLNETYNLANVQNKVTMLDLAYLIKERAQEKGLLPSDYDLTFNTVKSYVDDVQYRVPNVDKFPWLLETSLVSCIDKCLENISTKTNLKV